SKLALSSAPLPSSTNLDSDSLSSPARLSVSLSECEEHLDRLQQVELARTAPMSRWRAGTVQAWLEVIMAMPMYIRACADNVKSGKVLLAVTDEDLEFVLGISNSMHRRKLRLAIEDYRDAESGHGLSKAADLDHHWVAQAWLTDVGLPQYSQFFHTHLVDGRLLSTLTHTDLEKHLHMSKKAHQNSLLLGIELLQTLNFDKEILQSRRSECENQNTDPVVWTCRRIIKWIKEIDLKEFADNLQNSGVHGAIMVLDPSFSCDTMAAALCIPSNKHMVRHHLNEEMKALVSAARSSSVSAQRISLDRRSVTRTDPGHFQGMDLRRSRYNESVAQFDIFLLLSSPMSKSCQDHC
ncbi:hypothetical protein cypCar_00046314, partial [Cyprinus carpio]